MDEESIRKDFANQVTAAVKLRDFMASERHSYHIPDKVIDDIEAARQVVILNRTPTAEERAALAKAYRDLVLVPDTSITYSGVPPAEFWQCGSPWTNAMIWLSAVPALLLLVYVNRLLVAHPDQWSPVWHLPVAYAATSAALIWGMYVCTGVVTDVKLNRMIGTCYAFTLLALVVSVVPFVFDGNALMNSTGQISLVRGCAVGQDVSIPAQSKCDDHKPSSTPQWVINIGGLMTEQDPPSKAYKITTGLVVPLYVIVLALFGSAVSMTRRVPEYQRRAMSAQDSMSNIEAREKLVFQIMQVISAPLIAVTAYAIVKPGSLSEAVVVGFGSGFASEPILLMIRGMVDKISPTAAAPAGSVAVKVAPLTSSPRPGDTISFSAQVTGVANTAVTWRLEPNDPASGTITAAGLYTAPVPVLAAKDVTVTAISAADLNKSGTAMVKLVPPAAIALATPAVPVTMKPNDIRRFTAVAAATWVVDPPGPASGAIADGEYTAPTTPLAVPVTVTARRADGTAIGSATVTIAA